MANKDCHILLFDIHVVYRTEKLSFSRRISEEDGKQADSKLHSNVQLLFSLINAIVLCRPRIIKSLMAKQNQKNHVTSGVFCLSQQYASLKSSNITLDPSCCLAERTIDGDEYASEVTHVQWNVQVIRNTVIKPIITVATSFLIGYEGSTFFVVFFSFLETSKFFSKTKIKKKEVNIV